MHLHILNGLQYAFDGVAIVHFSVITIGDGAQPNPKSTALITEGSLIRQLGQYARTESFEPIQVRPIGQNWMEREEKVRHAVKVLHILGIRDVLALRLYEINGQLAGRRFN